MRSPASLARDQLRRDRTRSVMCGSMGYVETTLEIREMLVALARRYAFRELAYLLGGGATGLALSQREVARIQQLCAYGKRLIELDTEDLDEANAAIGATTDTTFATLVGTSWFPRRSSSAGELCRVRQEPKEGTNDALTSLHPMYRLLLEVIQVRWDRNDTMWLLSAVHIAAEYAPLLAWQRYLGHAGDPFRLRDDPAFTRSRQPMGPHRRPRLPTHEAGEGGRGPGAAGGRRAAVGLADLPRPPALGGVAARSASARPTARSRARS